MTALSRRAHFRTWRSLFAAGASEASRIGGPKSPSRGRRRRSEPFYFDVQTSRHALDMVVGTPGFCGNHDIIIYYRWLRTILYIQECIPVIDASLLSRKSGHSPFFGKESRDGLSGPTKGPMPLETWDSPPCTFGARRGSDRRGVDSNSLGVVDAWDEATQGKTHQLLGHCVFC